MTKRQIATSFSLGKFEGLAPYLNDNIEWNALQIFHLFGKEEVLEQCRKSAAYFNSLSTDFRQNSVIEEHNTIAITGTADFSEDGKRIEFVSSCDVFEFGEQGDIIKITSYCIVKKESSENTST